MRIRSVLSHSVQAVAEGSLIALLVVGLMAGSVLGARPTGGGGGKPGAGSGTSTIALELMNGATEAHYRAQITFRISTTDTVYPYVHLRCSQGTRLVLEGWQGFFPTALGNPWFYLGPTPSWSSGAADCTANLEKANSKGGWTVLKSTSFHVYE